MRSLQAALCVALLALCGALAPQPATADVAGQEHRIRYQDTVHGGFATAANSVVTCGEATAPDAAPCEEAQAGGPGRGADYTVAYVDVDDDENTYNSSRAELRLPPGAEVVYARLYWGANIRVGEQKPRQDNNRVLFAEPNGRYKEVLAADGDVVSVRTDGYESFVASAEVTDLMRHVGSGTYTVGQVNAASGSSPAGGWGGWALVVAYEDADEPLRDLALLDGFPALTAGQPALAVDVEEPRVTPESSARLGLVAFGGDRGRAGDAVTVLGAGPLSDAANPANDVMNSTISDRGAQLTAGREPAYRNTLGLDADVLDLDPAPREGPLRLRFSAGGDPYQLGAVFLQADADTTARQAAARGRR